MPHRLIRTLAAAAIGCAMHGIAAGATDAFSVLHHEKVQAIVAARDDAGREHVSFEAYGRRFDLRLEPNERIARVLGKAMRTTRPLRGSLEGVPDSWARLTLNARGGWHGMFFDGQDVYAIEPASGLTSSLVQPVPANADEPVIFRLTDAMLPTGTAYCGTSGSEHGKNALEALKAVGREAPVAQGLAPARRLLVSLVADHEFASFFGHQGTSPEEAIVQRMNIVDGIFSSQLGVHLELGATTVFEDPDDPFTAPNANDLLEQLRAYRARTPRERESGITHLMTGRELDGDTVGIAYIGTVCAGGTATSLTQGIRSTTAAALITAHEIGHNFNAPHDGDAGAACATTPKTYLMAPRLTGSEQFSSCSLQQMQPLATSGWCLTELSTDATTSGPDGGDTTGSPDPTPPGGDGSDGIDPPTDPGGGGGMIAFSTLLGLLLALRARSIRRRRG
jgi:hypothetical protein